MFKLIEFEFTNHPILEDLRVKFCDDGEQDAENYTTLIIGPNGTGKSQILLSIINIFNSIAESKRNPNKQYKFSYQYRLLYYVNGRFVDLTYYNGQLQVDGDRQYNVIARIPTPAKLLISSYSFNDKYPLRSNRGKIVNKDYYYLGLKSTNNNIFIYNPPKDAIDNLCLAIDRQRDVRPLHDAFEILGLRPEIEVVYEPGKHFKYLQENDFWATDMAMTPDEFRTSFKKYVDDKKKKKIDTTPQIGDIKITYGDEKIERTLDFDEGITNTVDLERRNIGLLIDYLRGNNQFVTNVNNKELVYKPAINFTDPNTIDTFTEHIKPFKVLRDLGIISFERFEVKKLENGFSFENASSGEYHVIITLLNLLSLIEDNSLVLIDEPEISLHPNWQIRYMDIFNRIFARFSSCHFVIASHSHFMVSDMKSTNSHITSLYFDVNTHKIQSKVIERSTYGWSAEQILLEVFNVATTRNYFLIGKVGNILQQLSQKDFNRQKVLSDIDALREFEVENLSDDDPMKDVIKKLLAKLV